MTVLGFVGTAWMAHWTDKKICNSAHCPGHVALDHNSNNSNNSNNNNNNSNNNNCKSNNYNNINNNNNSSSSNNNNHKTKFPAQSQRQQHITFSRGWGRKGRGTTQSEQQGS